MKFFNPLFLLLLPLVTFLFIAGIKSIKNFLERRNRFIKTETFLKLKLKNNTVEKYISLLILNIIIVLAIVSLARPLGKEINKEFEGSGRDIVIAVDISDSMKANDVNLSGSYAEYVQTDDLYGLTRFDAAKKIIKNFIKLLNGDRVSLVAFSNNAFPLSPLTNDYDVFFSFLNSLDFSYAENGSTNIAEAIEVAGKRFNSRDKSDAKIIIIISDGEDHNGLTLEKAREAKRNNIIVNTVGLGSDKGSKIPLGKDFYGNETYKRYLGQDVITSLNDKSLKEISFVTGGKYFQVKEEDISQHLYNEVYKVEPNKYKTVRNIEYEELFQIFIIAIILLLTIETTLPLYFQDMP